MATPILPASSAKAIAPSKDVLQETLCCLWSTVKKEKSAIKEYLPGMSGMSEKILFHRSASKYADVAYEYITTKAHIIMGGSNFTVV
ncbi:hypothetical protein KAF25_009573 [Fusarium avenaceum]|uniref:Uncharacterized protein n=1 Tax=Fusarium avenaceum TaxID=40199 RepID=A0A9P7HFG0_9HYPO|nr:hypothetical protein KAF25_009573 [Fusarium avenaceum]